MTTREQAEKAAVETYNPSEHPRNAFVRGWEAREALLPSVEDVADMLSDLDVSDPDLAFATYEEQAVAVLALIKGVDTAD